MDHDVGQHEQVSSCESSDVVDTQTPSLISSIKVKVMIFFSYFLFLIFFFFYECTPGHFDVNVTTRLKGRTVYTSNKGMLNDTSTYFMVNFAVLYQPYGSVLGPHKHFTFFCKIYSFFLKFYTFFCKNLHFFL